MALVVFTGGARSGKSALAQDLARRRALDGARVTVAVFARMDGDRETAARIERHRRDRPADFQVVEAADNASWLNDVDEHDVLLVDCLGTLVTLVLDEVRAETLQGEDQAFGADTISEATAERVTDRVDALVQRMLERPGDTILVTNEVGDGVVPAFPAARLFRDVLGRANRRLVQSADAAYLVVCGRTIDLLEGPGRVEWPRD